MRREVDNPHINISRRLLQQLIRFIRYCIDRRIDDTSCSCDHSNMKAVHSGSFRELPATTEVGAAGLEELQAVCARIAEAGGESGEIAADIARISRELSALAAKIDDFLAS